MEAEHIAQLRLRSAAHGVACLRWKCSEPSRATIDAGVQDAERGWRIGPNEARRADKRAAAVVKVQPSDGRVHRAGDGVGSDVSVDQVTPL